MKSTYSAVMALNADNETSDNQVNCNETTIVFRMS